MKRVAVIGASGFVGRYVCEALRARGDEVVGFSRTGQGKAEFVNEWRQNPAAGESWDFRNIHAIINLAGERVTQRWTEKNRETFYRSRVELSKSVAATLRGMEEKPAVWINASGVGYYGDTEDAAYGEEAPQGEGYLAELCAQWEQAASGVEGVRIAYGRIGIVLGRGGMAWDQLKLLFSLGLGARLGHGRQWMAWIHIDDVVGGMLHALDHQEMHGAFNLVSPNPERNADFTRKLGKAVKRPAFWIAPAFVLRIALGDFSSAVLGGQRVSPQVLLMSGYAFRYATAEAAFAQLI
jgi:uncharacterized protein (TIGR01777 family)